MSRDVSSGARSSRCACGKGPVALSPADISLVTDPSGGAEFLPDGRIRLLQSGTLRLTVRRDQASATTALDVQAPPRIVFQFAQAGNTDIYGVALDGGELRRLTDHTAADQEPTSAAGMVVFVSHRNGRPELFSVPAGGGSAVRLTSVAGGATRPALSADGSRLAYLLPEAGLQRLWLAGRDGRDALAAARGGESGPVIDGSPSFAPAGDRIVFMSTRQGTADLWISTQGGPPQPLVVHGAADVEPAWSPDGRHVVFVSNRDGGTALYLAEVATGSVKRLTHTAASVGRPAWLPDGRIAFTAFEPSGARVRWLDPARADSIFEVPLPTGAATNPVAER
jgi:Tol biopolymer transport system component